MHADRFTGHDPALRQLAADMARLCHAREVVLTCGTEVIVRNANSQGERFVIATQPFGAGAEAYELNLFDGSPRELSPTECGAFEALTAAFQRQLEQLPAVTPPPNAGWVKDHVTLALDYVTDSFILVLGDWTIQHINTQFERSVGCKRSEVIGRDLWEVFPAIRGTRFESEARIAMAGTVPRVFEEFSRPLGRWFQSRAFPCREVSIDITERKADEAARLDIERKLLQAQRMESLGTLAGGIAHDFNNILGAILGNVGLLKDLVAPESPAFESVDQIRVAGERARDLVRQILAYSRSTTREFVRQPLRPLIEKSVRLLRSTLPASVRLEVDIADTPLSATVDGSEVQQLLMNLCTNALQALPRSQGRISVRLRPVQMEAPPKADVGELHPGLYAELSVADTGTGMSEEARMRLFEPFFTTKPRGQGTGLGLHVLNGFVSAHRGRASS